MASSSTAQAQAQTVVAQLATPVQNTTKTTVAEVPKNGAVSAQKSKADIAVEDFASFIDFNVERLNCMNGRMATHFDEKRGTFSAPDVQGANLGEICRKTMEHSASITPAIAQQRNIHDHTLLAPYYNIAMSKTKGLTETFNMYDGKPEQAAAAQKALDKYFANLDVPQIAQSNKAIILDFPDKTQFTLTPGVAMDASFVKAIQNYKPGDPLPARQYPQYSDEQINNFAEFCVRPNSGINVAQCKAIGSELATLYVRRPATVAQR